MDPPPFGKTPNYFRFFLMKASLKYPINKQNKLKESCAFNDNDHICNLQSTVYKITTPPLGKVTFDYVKVVYIADNKGGSTIGKSLLCYDLSW